MGEPETRSSKEELHSLDSTLKNVQDIYLNKWLSQDIKTFIQDDILAVHQVNMKKAKENLADTKARLEKCQQQEHTNSAMEKEKIKVKAELKLLTQNHQVALLQKESDEASVARLRDAIAKQQHLLDTKVKAAEANNLRTNDLIQMLKWYEERLAITFKKLSGGKLQVTFTNIDPKAPSDPFFFISKFDNSMNYEILQCEPPVPDLRDLQQKLNETNNFRSFIIHMHRRFKAFVSKNV